MEGNDVMSWKETLTRINKCQSTGNVVLNLKNLGLNYLPKKLWELTHLEELVLGEVLSDDKNRLGTLPTEIGKLTRLRTLGASNIGLKEIPYTIGQLKQLQTLNLSSNQLTYLPDTIGQLRKLRILNLDNNELTQLPHTIGQLEQLKQLDLGKNKLTQLPDTIGYLEQLTYLNLPFNQITHLPDTLSNILQLKVINIGGIPLIEIPSWLGKLKNLEKLWLWSHSFGEMPHWIQYLTRLDGLHLSNCDLIQLPDWLGNLTNLKVLYLYGNQLTTLPLSFTNLTNLEKLDLRENPLPIPTEVLANYENPATILDYIRAMHRDVQVPITEVKVLVVGEADVGKSALIEKLVHNRFDEKTRNPTAGIVIEDWAFTAKGRDLTLHLWDFGGQEIMHNTHRLFLTTRSCYLLVLDATQNEESNKVVHWLKTIATYAPDAPVIIAVNKSDKFRLRLNLQELSNHHPIVAAIDTSCASGEGMLDLRMALSKALTTLPHLDEVVPQRWMNVRRVVADSGKDYLEKPEFQAVCEAEEVGDTSQSIADVLHYLGVLFTYSDDRTLRRTHLLNPNWVTQGIYPILTDPTLNQRGGIVSHIDIERILPADRYPADILPFIVGMMFNFELAFEVPLQRGQYLVPDLLPKEPPKHEWDDSRALLFSYHYDFLPAGIFSRFVVQMQDEVNPDLVWRSGVLLHQFGKPYSRVTVNGDAKTITLSILPSNSRHDPRALLDTLRHRLETLHATFPGLKVTAMVPISTKGDIYPYDNLLELERQGFQEYFVPFVGKINVTALLDGISHSRSLEVNPTGRDSGDSLPHSPRPARATFTPVERQQQLKRLLPIVIDTVGNKSAKARQLFLEYADLGMYNEKLNFDLEGQAFSQQLVMALKKAGLHPDYAKPALDVLLEALCDERSGHPDDVTFLRGMMGGS